MITRYGLSDELGPVLLSDDGGEPFLGYSMTQSRSISEDTAQRVDAEVRRLIDEAHTQAQDILNEREKDLETLAQGLLEYETLTGDEIRGLLKGEKPKRDEDIDVPAEPVGGAVPETGRLDDDEEEAGEAEPRPA
jgi:cell division protease FtsH